MRSQRELLASLVGVWEGTYRTFGPDDRFLGGFPSRQELRLVADCWYERIAYLRSGGAPEVHDFRAAFDAGGPADWW